MGSCFSVDKYPTSTMRLCCSVGSTKSDEILVPSPIKEKPLKNDEGLVVSSDVVVKAKTQTPFHSFGSKEEQFFDSQPWLESDCEDFYSVNGDFTPSRGNTPVHHNFSSAPQRKVTDPEKAPVLLPEPSPKKRLSELFKDSVREHLDSDGQDGANKNNDKPVTGSPYASGPNSGYSAERNPNGRRTPDEASVRSPQCCLPRLHSFRTYSGRKKSLSTVPTVG